MSNRIAASRKTDAVALVAWPPLPSPWQRLGAAARAWLRAASAPDSLPGLSPRLRRDLGLAAASVAAAPLLDVEARRLGF